MISIDIILPLISQIFIIFLGGLVFFKNPKNRINRVFFFLILFGFFWLLSGFLSDVFKTYQQALFWARVAIIGPVIMGSLFLYLSYIFPKERKKIIPLKFKHFLLFFIPGIIFIVLTPTYLNIKEIKIHEWGTEFVPGPLYYFLFFYLIFYFGFGLKNFWENYKITKEKEDKYQILYFLFGFILAAVIGILTNLILPLMGWSFPSKFGPSVSLLAFTFFTSYSILKYHLFEIRVILIELLVGLIGIILLIQISSAASFAWMILNIIVFLFFCFIGYLLIKGVLREIKYRKEIQSAYQELKVLDKAKSEFISMASHQLRTPLSITKGYISMLLEGSYGQLPGKAREKIGNVFQSNERLIKLVNDLLNISKIELGKIEIEKKPTQIEDLIQSCYDEMKTEAEKKGLKFFFQKPEISLPKINIDQLKIRQVILNLIDNAIRYTQKGEIKIKAEKINSIVRVSVKDTGEGLSREERENIFEGFTRGSAGLTFFIEGAGLGLYVAQKFIKLHNGKIRVESRGKSKGSTFYVELPIR